MLSRVGNRKKVILSTLLMVLLIWGVQGVSYASDLSFLGMPTVNRNIVPGGGDFSISFWVQSQTPTNGTPVKANVVTLAAYDITNNSAEAFAGSATINSLAPGNSLPGSITVTVPSSVTSMPSRRYEVRIVSSDPDGSDTNTTNNTSQSVTVTVTAATADLTISRTLSVNPRYSVIPGGSITLTAYVSNTGGAQSPSTTFKVYRSSSGGTDSGTLVRTFTDTIVADVDQQTVSSPTVRVPTSPGTYYYRVQIGDDQDNSTSYTAVIVTNPVDLSAGTPTVNKSTVAPGETFTLSTTVRNVGTGNFTGTTTLRYFQSADTTLNRTDGSDTQVGTDTISALLASYGTTSANITLTAPSEPGTYYYFAYVDPVPGEQYYNYANYYGNTANNESSYVMITVSAPLDLTVNLDRPQQTTFAPGERFILDATVSNTGAGASATTQLQVYEDSDDYRREQQITSRSVSAISANGSTSVSFQITAPLEAGTYYYRVYVEAVAGETKTDNNYSNWVGIDVVESLVLESLQPSKVSLVSGESFTLTATVKNDGNTRSAGTIVRYYRSNNNSLSRSDTRLGSRTVSRIPAGGTTQVSISLTAPQSPGTYYYGACVGDSQTYSGDACAVSVGIDVLEPLVLESLQPSKVALASGESFTLTATVKNDGNARSAGTIVQYYRSSDNSLSSRDTRLGSSTVSRIPAGGTTQVSIPLTAPQSLGTYYYGACVGDSETYSGSACEIIKITVVKVTISGFQRPPMDWVDADSGTLQNLTGSEVDPFVASVRNATAIAIDMAGGKVYWAEQIEKNRSRVRRANLNGRNIEVVKEMGGAVRGLAVDSAKGNLYMTNARPNGRGNIQRSKLDGSVFHWNYIDNLSPSLSSPRDIALDVAGGKVYWTEDITDAATGKEIIRIRRANLNGKNVEVVREISGVPRGLAVDSAKGNLYLANTRGVRGNIQRLKVDGSLFHWNYIHIAKANSPQGVALDVADGKVYWTEAGGIRRADLNGKNRQDVATGIGSPGGIVLRVAPVSTAAAAAPAAAPIAPNTTALHANYPNPFNPETWIPYQLREAADVQISIYDPRGVLVRQLSLGHQVAGQYLSRSRAAYWDGRNEVGEPVASGLYFYTLTAGDFSATRKMLIVK